MRWQSETIVHGYGSGYGGVSFCAARARRGWCPQAHVSVTSWLHDREDASWHSYDSSIAEGTEESVSGDYVIIIDKLIIEV